MHLLIKGASQLHNENGPGNYKQGCQICNAQGCQMASINVLSLSVVPKTLFDVNLLQLDVMLPGECLQTCQILFQFLSEDCDQGSQDHQLIRLGFQ